MSKHQKYALCFITLCVAIVSYVSVFDLSSPYLWYDEAGQFWIAKGLNHYSEPFSAIQGLREVIENNRLYNMDPGGFSIILHYWTMISDHHVWLRMLPWLFFCGFCLMLFKLSLHYTNSHSYSLLIAVLPFILPVLAPRAVELRAYSMEMFGTITAVYLLSINKELGFYKVLLLSLFLCLICTARYGFILVALGFSLYATLRILTNTHSKHISSLLALYFPLIVCIALIYFCMMKYQNANATPLYYIEGKYIRYHYEELLSPLSLIFYSVAALSAYKYAGGG